MPTCILADGEDYFLDLNKRLAKYAPDGWLEKVRQSIVFVI